MFKTVSSTKAASRGWIPRSTQQLGTFEIVAAALALAPRALLLPERALVELVTAPDCLDDGGRPDQDQIEEHQDQQGLDVAEPRGDHHPAIQKCPPERNLVAHLVELRLFSCWRIRARASWPGERTLRGPFFGVRSALPQGFARPLGAKRAGIMTCAGKKGNRTVLCVSSMNARSHRVKVLPSGGKILHTG